MRADGARLSAPGADRAPRLRAAIVGAGLMGRWHADAVTHAGHAVAYVVDASSARAAALASAHRGARTADSLDDIAAGTVDVVHVCTPLASHVELASAALRRGCHTIVEKPLAADAAATDGLLRVAAEGARMLVPVHQFPFQRGLRAALRTGAETLGPLLHLDFVTCTAGAEGGDDRRRDAVAAEILPHPLSLIARVAPAGAAEVPWGDATDWRVLHPAAGELRVSATLGAVSVAMLISTRGRPPVNRLRLVHERGTVQANLFHGFATVERGGASRALKLWHPFDSASRTLAAAGANLVRRGLARERAYPGLRELVREVYDAAARARSSPIPPAEVRAIAVARDAILARGAMRDET